MSFPLVSANQLHTELGRWAVVDASVVKTSAAEEPKAYRADRDAFAFEHIRGARFADLITDFSDPSGAFPFARPAANQFQAAARRLGISNSDRIVVYDRANGIWAARLWWLFGSFGHGRVAVLDGGFRRWRDLGLPVSSGEHPGTEGDFEAVEQPRYFVDRDAVKDIVAGRARAQLLNVLRQPVFHGREQSYARPGHIPGSLNVPYAGLLAADNTLLGRDELAGRFGAIVADPRPIVTYCGGGITAAGAALALALLGRNDVAVYDGSLNEWTADPDLPLVIDR